jgi:Protein of unknown function (DUF433)
MMQKGMRLRRERLVMAFTRITVDPEKMGGVPCIRGLRIPVATVVEMEALRYAAVAVREREIPLLSAP